MRILSLLSFLAVSVLFSGCGKEAGDEKPKIHEINFEIFDGNPKSNPANKGFRFWRYIKINLNNDSVFLKANQQTLDEYENGKKPAEYYISKLATQLKNQINSFSKNLNLYPNGKQYNEREYEGALYCGKDFYSEFRNGSITKYFYFKQEDDTTQSQKTVNALFRFAFRIENLQKKDSIFFVNDDSIVSPIVNRSDFDLIPPPPMVKSTIKFMPPVEMKKH